MISSDSLNLGVEVLQGMIDEYDELILNLSRKRAALRLLLEHVNSFELSHYKVSNDVQD